jgi:hypothetical protein
MDMINIAKQTIVFNKTAVNKSFNAMIMAQVQMGIVADTFLNQIPGFPPEGKRLIDDWTTAHRDGWDQLRKAIVDTFDQVENMFNA